jgi:CheY-like chemotaxis protein
MVRIYTRDGMGSLDIGTRPTTRLVLIVEDDTLSAHHPNRARRKRPLIVEDDQPTLRLLNDVLEVCGYEILKTTEGLEAVNLARDNRPD